MKLSLAKAETKKSEKKNSRVFGLCWYNSNLEKKKHIIF
jgi:hypothetical protein